MAFLSILDIEVSTTDQIIPLIIHNLGIAFYPRKLAQPYLDKGEVYETRCFNHYYIVRSA